MKIKIHYTIDDDPNRLVCVIDSSLTIQQTLQLIRDKKNDQNIQYAYIKSSMIEDFDDLISDWNDSDTVFNFRHSKISSSNSDTSSSSDIYKFTVYTTSNWESLTKGQSFNLNKNLDRNQFEDLVRDYCSIQSHIPISQIKLLVFLPGGVEFINTTIKEYVETVKPKNLYMYVIIAKGISSNLLSKEIVEICDTRSEMSTVFSPLVDSTDTGKQLFACLISSLFHQTTGRKELVSSLSKITGFPPLIASLQALIDRKTITGKDLIIITSTLFPIFKYFLDNTVPENKILESCTKLCNLISQIDDSSEIPLESHTIDSTTDTSSDIMLSRIESYMSLKRLTTLVYWKPDFELGSFQKTEVTPFSQKQLQNAWDEKQHFKPVMPLTLRQVHVSSIVYGPGDSYRVFTMEATDSKELEASSKVDLINPENGETAHVDIEEFARTVTNRVVDGEKIELIDEESVQQITMVLIDQSGSMASSFGNGNDMSRDSIAKQFLTSWASKSFGYRISSLQGLISFATDVTVKSELSPLIPDFEKSVMDTKPGGWTSLWPAIKQAAEMLVAKQTDPVTHQNKFKKAALRILVLTDGVNYGNDMTQYDVLPYLIEHNIIVDAVIVSWYSSSKDLCVLSQLTGGLAFRPQTVEEGIALFEKEALLCISYRETPKPFTGEVTKAHFESLVSNLALDTEPKNKLIMQARARKPLMTPRCAVKGLDGTSQSRLRRIAKELRIAHRWEDQEVKVYPIEDLADVWRIYIKGPEGTLYENKWWDLFATFPENYPFSPPVFRFITVPFHINISDEGRICMNTLGSDYSSSTNVMELIANIKALLILPNYDDPIDIAKLTLYNKSSDHSEFIQKVRDSTQKAQSNVDDYLAGTPISDDQTYEVPRENYIPGHHRCPITGVPLNPANLVIASSGIRYDRDALKRLLRSSSTPRCVVTDELLTDDPNTL